MTTETPAPASAPRRGRVLLPTIIVLVVIVVGFVIFTGFYTDWLWYESVDATSVYTVTLYTRIIMFFAFGATMAFIIAGTMWLAYRFWSATGWRSNPSRSLPSSSSPP